MASSLMIQNTCDKAVKLLMYEGQGCMYVGDIALVLPCDLFFLLIISCFL